MTRGICRVDVNGMLQEIIETHNIEKDGDKAVVREGDIETEYDADSPVSMNMWGLTPEFFCNIKERIEQFLNKTDMEDLKAEYLLPTIIGELLKEGTVSVKVLKSEDQWFGVTYKEDRETVVEAVKSLIDKRNFIRTSCKAEQGTHKKNRTFEKRKKELLKCQKKQKPTGNTGRKNQIKGKYAERSEKNGSENSV